MKGCVIMSKRTEKKVKKESSVNLYAGLFLMAMSVVLFVVTIISFINKH
jgi:hypothetical protein